MKNVIAASALALLAATGAFAQTAETTQGLGVGGLDNPAVAAGAVAGAVVFGVILSDDDDTTTTTTTN